MQIARFDVHRLAYICHLLSLITNLLLVLWFSFASRASAHGFYLFTIWSKYTKQLPLQLCCPTLILASILLLALCLQSWCRSETWKSFYISFSSKNKWVWPHVTTGAMVPSWIFALYSSLTAHNRFRPFKKRDFHSIHGFHSIIIEFGYFCF